MFIRSPLIPKLVTAVGSMLVIACSSDGGVAPMTALTDTQATGRGIFQRYVAIGTSISAGVQSDGLTAQSQQSSWPVQLASLAGRELSLPLIDGPGCRSPLVAPLALGTRLSGEAAGADASGLSCAPLRAGIALPVDNLAMNGALAADALLTTPENITDLGNAGVYHRVLQPGRTAVATMMASNPKLVSIELGGNELLNARSGIAIPGVTLYPLDKFKTLYTMILDSAQKATKTVLVVGLINDVGNFPAFRRGSEMWAARQEFAAFNVVVDDDCNGNDNLLFVPVRVPTAVGTAAAYAKAGAGAYTLSCAPGAAADQDFVLTPAEAATVNAQMHEMTAFIQAEASRRKLAYFALGELYDRPDLKPPFSVAALMTTDTPYGAFISLDGMHPTARGQQVLANAAAAALNTTYQLGIQGR